MDIEEADKLVLKNITVILSCETLDQLNTAATYANLVYRKIAKEIGLVNNSQFITVTERAIGYAQCKIKNYHH